MRTDELRRELDTLAGSEPAVDEAWAAVNARVRRGRALTSIGVLTVSLLVIGGVAVARHNSSNPAQVIVRNPPVEPVGNVADFTWTRLGAPFQVERVAAVNGQ